MRATFDLVGDAMRIAILADIHGNVLALEAILADLESRKVDEYVNLGDCVSGPLWPRETAELLIRLGRPTVRGNHDCRMTDCPPESTIGRTHSPIRHLIHLIIS